MPIDVNYTKLVEEKDIIKLEEIPQFNNIYSHTSLVSGTLDTINKVDAITIEKSTGNIIEIQLKNTSYIPDIDYSWPLRLTEFYALQNGDYRSREAFHIVYLNEDYKNIGNKNPQDLTISSLSRIYMKKFQNIISRIDPPTDDLMEGLDKQYIKNNGHFIYFNNHKPEWKDRYLEYFSPIDGQLRWRFLKNYYREDHRPYIRIPYTFEPDNEVLCDMWIGKKEAW